jgi:hypothetical protein
MKELRHREASFNDFSKGPTLTNAKRPDPEGAHDIDQHQKIHYLTSEDIAEMSSLDPGQPSIKMDQLVPSWGRLLVFSSLPP